MCLPIIPIFVLPYKRYAGPTLLYLAGTYVEGDRTSYRKTVRPNNRPTGYVTPPDEQEIDERALAHSTVWRMLSWLGCQMAALSAGRELILQCDPSSRCHRFVGSVEPQKYRSPQREQLLRQSRQLLHVAAEWNENFPETFFPRFATSYRFS